MPMPMPALVNLNQLDLQDLYQADPAYELQNLGGWGIKAGAKGWVVEKLLDDAFKGRPVYLQNLDLDQADPTFELQNLGGWGAKAGVRGWVVEKGLDAVFKGRPAYLQNLDMNDIDLQNLGWKGAVGSYAVGKALDGGAWAA